MTNQNIIVGGGHYHLKDCRIFFFYEWGLNLRRLMALSLSIFSETFTRLLTHSLELIFVKCNLDVQAPRCNPLTHSTKKRMTGVAISR